MRLFEAAGLPPGVINMVTGDGIAVSDVALADPDLAGIHFTGSTRVFQHLWQTVGNNIANYRTYPRLVGETGGKDFVIAHPSADADALLTALTRGAFDYQGQKCSAASRAYIPRSIWDGGLRDRLAATADGLTYGDVTDFTQLRRRGDRRRGRSPSTRRRWTWSRNSPACTVIAGGTADDSRGLLRPADRRRVHRPDPRDLHDRVLRPDPVGVRLRRRRTSRTWYAQAESVSPYALTGSIFATDRRVVEWASKALRYAAGNFYINDKPTGAVVGQQPFGGARASGTNDKAGSWQNLVRWMSPRTIKETFVPPTDHTYPHMG